MVGRTPGLYFVEPETGYRYHRRSDSESEPTPMEEDSGDEGVPASRYTTVYGPLVRFHPPRVARRGPDPQVAPKGTVKMEVDLPPPASGGARPKTRSWEQGKSAASTAPKITAPTERPRRDDSVDEVARALLSREIRSGKQANNRDDTGGWGLIPVEKTGATTFVPRPTEAARPDHRNLPTPTTTPRPSTSGWKAPTASALATASGKPEAKKGKSQADKQRTWELEMSPEERASRAKATADWCRAQREAAAAPAPKKTVAAIPVVPSESAGKSSDPRAPVNQPIRSWADEPFPEVTRGGGTTTGTSSQQQEWISPEERYQRPAPLPKQNRRRRKKKYRPYPSQREAAERRKLEEEQAAARQGPREAAVAARVQGGGQPAPQRVAPPRPAPVRPMAPRQPRPPPVPARGPPAPRLPNPPPLPPPAPAPEDEPWRRVLPESYQEALKGWDQQERELQKELHNVQTQKGTARVDAEETIKRQNYEERAARKREEKKAHEERQAREAACRLEEEERRLAQQMSQRDREAARTWDPCVVQRRQAVVAPTVASRAPEGTALACCGMGCWTPRASSRSCGSFRPPWGRRSRRPCLHPALQPNHHRPRRSQDGRSCPSST